MLSASAKISAVEMSAFSFFSSFFARKPALMREIISGNPLAHNTRKINSEKETDNACKHRKKCDKHHRFE